MSKPVQHCRIIYRMPHLVLCAPLSQKCSFWIQFNLSYLIFVTSMVLKQNFTVSEFVFVIPKLLLLLSVDLLLKTINHDYIFIMLFLFYCISLVLKLAWSVIFNLGYFWLVYCWAWSGLCDSTLSSSFLIILNRFFTFLFIIYSYY